MFFSLTIPGSHLGAFFSFIIIIVEFFVVVVIVVAGAAAAPEFAYSKMILRLAFLITLSLLIYYWIIFEL